MHSKDLTLIINQWSTWWIRKHLPLCLKRIVKTGLGPLKYTVYILCLGAVIAYAQSFKTQQSHHFLTYLLLTLG